jgi:hypothetical protein
MPRAKQYWKIQAATEKNKQTNKKPPYTYNPVTNGTCVTLETYLTLVNTKSMVMLATITKVTYYNRT